MAKKTKSKVAKKKKFYTDYSQYITVNGDGAILKSDTKVEALDNAGNESWKKVGKENKYFGQAAVYKLVHVSTARRKHEYEEQPINDKVELVLE